MNKIKKVNLKREILIRDLSTIGGGVDQTSFPCNTVLRCIDTQAATNCGPLCPPSGLGCGTVSCPVGPL